MNLGHLQDDICKTSTCTSSARAAKRVNSLEAGRAEVAPEVPRYRAIGKIGEPVREQHPHDGDMPGDPAGEPAPERQTPGKGEG
jgi:hypothetical protein